MRCCGRRKDHRNSVFHRDLAGVHVPGSREGNEVVYKKSKAVIMVPADIAKEDAIAAGKAAVEGKITGNIVKEIYVAVKSLRSYDKW